MNMPNGPLLEYGNYFERLRIFNMWVKLRAYFSVEFFY